MFNLRYRPFAVACLLVFLVLTFLAEQHARMRAWERESLDAVQDFQEESKASFDNAQGAAFDLARAHAMISRTKLAGAQVEQWQARAEEAGQKRFLYSRLFYCALPVSIGALVVVAVYRK